MPPESSVTHQELQSALQPYVTRAELEALLKGFAPEMQLAIVNGIKEIMPELLEKFEDRYGGKVNNMHQTLYNEEKGLVITVDRIAQLVKEIPDLVRLKWQLFAVVLATNIVAGVAGFALSQFVK